MTIPREGREAGRLCFLYALYMEGERPTPRQEEERHRRETGEAVQESADTAEAGGRAGDTRQTQQKPQNEAEGLRG